MNMRAAISQRPHAARVALALGLVYIVWGSTYLAIRVTVETIPPLLSAGVRFLTAGAILYAFAIRRTPKDERPTPIHWRSAAIVGTALLLGGNGGVVLAESWGVPSGIAALLVGTVPLWMALISWVAFRDKLPAVGIAGLLAGFTGVAILAKPSGDFPLAGSLLIVLAALIWSSGSVYAQHAPLPPRPFLTTAMEMLTGGASLLIVGLLRGEAAGVDLAAFSGRSISALVYLIFVGSLVGYSAYIWALHNTRISLVSTYAYVNPVIAVILGAAILSEPFSALDLIAGSIIVGSVALIVAAKKPTPPASPADAPPPPDEAIEAQPARN
ncbi:MAG TPA: EamA family transporter [Actinomycetota bacterium]|nr:EamA family transporter [Actinomycetota bacterium]